MHTCIAQKPEEYSRQYAEYLSAERPDSSVQDDEFVQSVTVSKGKLPVIICHLQHQITHMARFCSKEMPATLRSLIGVDRMFNLGPCFVPTLVYTRT